MQRWSILFKYLEITIPCTNRTFRCPRIKLKFLMRGLIFFGRKLWWAFWQKVKTKNISSDPLPMPFIFCCFSIIYCRNPLSHPKTKHFYFLLLEKCQRYQNLQFCNQIYVNNLYVINNNWCIITPNLFHVNHLCVITPALRREIGRQERYICHENSAEKRKIFAQKYWPEGRYVKGGRCQRWHYRYNININHRLHQDVSQNQITHLLRRWKLCQMNPLQPLQKD